MFDFYAVLRIGVNSPFVIDPPPLSPFNIGSNRVTTAVHLTFSISCILVFDTRNIGATVFVTFIIFLAPCAPYSKQRDCYLSTHTTIYIKYLSHHTHHIIQVPVSVCYSSFLCRHLKHILSI